MIVLEVLVHARGIQCRYLRRNFPICICITVLETRALCIYRTAVIGIFKCKNNTFTRAHCAHTHNVTTCVTNERTNRPIVTYSSGVDTTTLVRGPPCGLCQRASGLGRSGVPHPSDKDHSPSRKRASFACEHHDQDDQDANAAQCQRQALQVFRVHIGKEDSERRPTEPIQEEDEETRERGEKRHSVGHSKTCGPSCAREPTVAAAPP